MERKRSENDFKEIVLRARLEEERERVKKATIKLQALDNQRSVKQLWDSARTRKKEDKQENLRRSVKTNILYPIEKSEVEKFKCGQLDVLYGYKRPRQSHRNHITMEKSRDVSRETLDAMLVKKERYIEA